MLFKAHLHQGLADGTVTVAFRRWQRPRARPGARHRTPVGVLVIDAVTVVTLADIGEQDAGKAGFSSRAALLEELDAYGAGDLYRIDFHFAGRDPREELREADELSDGDASFKADVRKLKELGLTQSLDIGYQISPRGRAYLDRL